MHVLILGFGIAGRTHAEAWREVEGVGKITTLDCRANAGADITADALAYLMNGVHRTFDLLDICLPHSLHAPVISWAESEGIPYIVEKPFVTSTEEARRLAELNEKSGVRSMVAENWLYIPAVERTIELLRSGAIGAIRFMRGHIEFWAERDYRTWYWDERVSGGGVVLSSGVHLFSVCRRIMGEPVRVEWAKITSESFGVEDGIVAAFSFASGTGVFVIDRSVQREEGAYRIVAVGTDGMLESDVKSGTVMLYSRGQAYNEAFQKSNGIKEVIREFYHYARGDRNGSRATLASEVGTIEMADMVYSALQSVRRAS